MEQEHILNAMIEEAARRHGVAFDPALVRKPQGGKMRLGAVLDAMRNKPQHLRARDVGIGKFTFQPAQGLLISDGQAQRLTEKERDILLTLLRAEGAAVGRDDMLRSVWGYVEGVETHTLETHVYRLRQKLEADPSRPEHVLTDGDGYRLKV